MGSVVNRISKTATETLFWSDLNEQNERKNDQGGLALDRKTMLTVFVATIACISLAMVSIPLDATDGTSYGSNIDPYGGIRLDYESLEDGATYFIVTGGSVYIDCRGLDDNNLNLQIVGTGIEYDSSTKSIGGHLSSSCTISVGEKTVRLEMVDSTYGDYPIYGVVNMDPIPDATVGEYYYQRVVLYEGGVGIGSHTYIVYTDDFDPTPYGLTITFDYHDSALAGGWVAAIISGTPSTTVDTEIVIRSSSHSWSYQEYRIPFQIVEPVYTITFDPGNGTCNTQTMTYNSPQDDLELPNAIPSQFGFHFEGWYTDPSGGIRVGGYGDNPFDVFTPNGDFTLYAHYAEDTNPVTSITITGSASIGIGESTILNAYSTLLYPDDVEGNGHVVWDLIDGEGVVSWGSEVNLDGGGRITVTGLSAGTATFRAMAADGSTDSDGQVVCDYFTISVSESPSVERNTFTLIYRPTISNVTNMPPTFSTTSTQSYYETQVAAIHPYHSQNTFLGWSYNSSASTVDIEPGDPISLPPGTTYLYAVWEPIQTMWTLAFDPNGGTGGPSQIQEYETGLSHTFRIPGEQFNPDPPDASKEFGGWSREPGSPIVAVYPGGSLYTTTQDTILYAIWNDVTELNEFTVHFDANRGSGAPSDITDYSADNTLIMNLPDSTPSRPGYDFLGWSLNPYWNEGDDYYPSNGSIMVYPGTTTLYAIWIQTNFTITFDPNNGTGGPGVIVASGSGAAQVMIPTSPDPTRDGYTFLGWSLEPNGQVDSEYAKGRLVTLNSNITLYAVWSQNSDPGGGDEPEQIDYEFHFIVGEGVENAPDDVVVTGDESGVTFQFPENILVMDGLRFVGWSNIENSDSAAWFANESYHFDSEHRVNYFYPVWEREIGTWSLSFHPNGGIGGPSTIYATPEGDTYDFTVPAEPQPTRAGYTFLGWDKDPNVNAPSIPATGGTCTAEEQDTVLYAIWAEGNEDTFTLSFDANGGSDAPASISDQDVGSHRFTIPLQYPNMDGMIFVGWSDSPTGGVVAYAGGTYVASSQDITLYAIWQTDDGTSKNFTVIYQPYPDADPIERLIASNGNSAIHTLMTEDDEEFPQRVGYTFVGWSETQGGRVIEDTTYRTGAMYVVLYGVWSSTSSTFPEAHIEYTADGLTVTFDGSMSPNALTWYWDMGDGTRYGLSSFEHTFPSAGTYLVSLTVTNGGQQDVKMIYITVEDDSGLSILTYVAIIAIIVIMVVFILRYKGVI